MKVQSFRMAVVNSLPAVLHQSKLVTGTGVYRTSKQENRRK